MDTPEQDFEQLQPQAYKALYEISRTIVQAQDVKTILRQIVKLARPVFIFDNIVLYELREDEKLAPTYARSVGRGQSAEADMLGGRPSLMRLSKKRKPRSVEKWQALNETDKSSTD